MGDSMSSIIVSGDTSGAITIAAPAVSGTNTLTLPANTGTILTTASSGQSIPKAALPTGSVLQVVQVTFGTETSTTSTSFVDLSAATLSITPTSATSKILVIFTVQCFIQSGSNSAPVRLVRDATTLETYEYWIYTNSTEIMGTGCYTYLDSPATTSSTTYKLQGRSRAGGTVAFMYDDANGDAKGSITLMEIAA
jgi:hypothetical protein